MSSTFGLHVVDSSSLVSVLFRETFNHPYICFFHLLVNGFLLYIYIYLKLNTKQKLTFEKHWIRNTAKTTFLCPKCIFKFLALEVLSFHF